MANIRSINEIIQSLIDYLKVAQPELDTKPGTVARDLLVDAPSNVVALLYEELSAISNQQSFRLVAGSDLDKLAKNFGLIRKSSTPASGVALLTFSSINAPININKGDSVVASNGFSYVIQNGLSVSPSLINFYKSVASKFKNDLDFVGIKDALAVEVTVKSSTSGVTGNLGKYSLVRTNIAGVSNVTNTSSFSGGNEGESDSAFRDRVLSAFSGSSIGTALGYQNTALSTTGVTDAFVVEPGDTLMTRDGSVVSVAEDGTRTVITEGTGGKVDVVVLGSSLTENIDSFIYQDKSNKNDPTDTKNIFVLGQISGDENKTINRKRIDNIKAGTLPAQPVQEMLEVTGSLSGSNFVAKTTDSFGRIHGNFELLKDTGLYGGCPWGFDSFHWVNNKVDGFSEDRIKGQYNGQDALTFTDVLQISGSQQNTSITNENSLVTSDRSVIQLLHTPVSSVTRVFNVNTGERYVVSNQNPDSTGATNTTGRVKISGNTLPTSSDVLQVDYTWVVSYDAYSDYDGILGTNNLRDVNDSIDWGYSSLIRTETIKFTRNVSNTYFVGTVSHPISSVVSVNQSNIISGVVTEVLSGVFAGRYSVILSDLVTEIMSINKIKLHNSSIELYSTAESNGSYSSISVVVGINVRYITTIILPTDTSAAVGQRVDVFVDTVDVFNISGANGNFNSAQITIPESNILSTANNILLETNYIANIASMLSVTVPFFPVSRIGNGYLLNKNTGFSNNFITNTSRKEVLVVQLNLSSQLYIELNATNIDNLITGDMVISVIRIVDGKELWNSDNTGTITANITNNNYQLILSGFNTPATGDRVLVVYYAIDTRRFQPFSFDNSIIKTSISNIATDFVNNQFYLPIQTFTSQASLNFKILEPNSDVLSGSGSDGYVISFVSTATFGSASIDFSTIPNILSKKIKIYGSSFTDNNGIFDIISYNTTNNSINIGIILNNIAKRQVSVLRLADGQDLWTSFGSINTSLNKLYFPISTSAVSGDRVLILYTNARNLKQASTKAAISVSDQTVNSGVMTVNGTTMTKAADVVFTATANSLKQSVLEAARKALKLNSSSTIPNNIKLVKIAKLEKVNTVSANSDEILSVVSLYDIHGTYIKDNSLFLDTFIENLSFGDFDFQLPRTSNNLSSQPQIGDKLRITFYYSTTDDYENLLFTRNGTLYTNKNFALINRCFIASGFTLSQSTRITINTFNQPISGSRYKVNYSYTAPKQNERITIRYNYNKTILDATFNIENSRPINADVIVRQAKEIFVDLTMNIVISDIKKSSADLVIQNLKDKLIAALTVNTLGTIIDSSDLINTAYSVDGIDRVRILYFNKNGSVGQVLSITSQKDEYFSPNNVVVNQETR